MPVHDPEVSFRTVAVRKRDGARLVIIQTLAEAAHAVAILPRKGWTVRVEAMLVRKPV
jgi:hypothetical protein